MILLPAIDLYDKKCVRLYKGDYSQMTVYSEDPLAMAKSIEARGASWIHLVDLEGAKDGTTPNIDIVKAIASMTDLNVEIGGGIRSYETIETYLASGVKRLILGTKAVEDRAFLLEALKRYGDAIAVGADAKNGMIATHGWLTESSLEIHTFVEDLRNIGVKTVIATDISKDGAMQGTNLELYRSLNTIEGIQIVASGGVSSLEDIKALKEIGVYGAILGKAMYNGAVKLEEGLEAAQ